MSSEILTYYEDSDMPILPFLVAPFQQQQDTLILAPKNISQEHDQFLNEVYKHVPSFNLDELNVRVFKYKSYIVVATIFSSNIKEQYSGRGGLVLTLGVLFDRKVFGQYDKVASRYFKLLLELVSDIFGVDLFSNGASVILEHVNNEDLHAVFKKNLSSLNKCYNTSVSVLRPNPFFNILKYLRVFNKKPLPKIIFCNDIDSKSYFKLVLPIIDNYLSFSLNNDIDISNNSFAIVKINYPLPSQADYWDYFKTQKRTYYVLY